MLKKKFGQSRHACEAQRKGDWVIHTCSQCDYELWDNMRTGETKILNSSPDVSHSGNYFPPAYLKALENQN